jgi:hypothetical protein
LLGAIHLDRSAEHAETGIVDHELDLGIGGNERGGDLVTGIVLFEIAGNDDRRDATSGDDFIREHLEAVGPARNQSDAMRMRCEHAGQFGADSRRGTGYQRHALSHNAMLLK